MAHLPFIIILPFAIAPDNMYYQVGMTLLHEYPGKRRKTGQRPAGCHPVLEKCLQRGLWCGCGRSLRDRGRFCTACYARRSRNRLYFGGLRDVVSERDGNCCRVCSRPGVLSGSLPVHHRRPGESRARHLITLCPSCHAIVHKLQILRRLLPPLLRTLWREQHPDAPEQLSLQFDRSSAVQHTAAVQVIGELFD